MIVEDLGDFDELPFEYGRYGHFIYALLDPRTRRLKYIGRTSYQPNSRLQGHVAAAKGGSNRPVCRWIRELLSMNLVPEMLVIASVAKGKEAEMFWIDEALRVNAALLNVSRKRNYNPRKGTGRQLPSDAEASEAIIRAFSQAFGTA